MILRIIIVVVSLLCAVSCQSTKPSYDEVFKNTEKHLNTKVRWDATLISKEINADNLMRLNFALSNFHSHNHRIRKAQGSVTQSRMLDDSERSKVLSDTNLLDMKKTLVNTASEKAFSTFVRLDAASKKMRPGIDYNVQGKVTGFDNKTGAIIVEASSISIAYYDLSKINEHDDPFEDRVGSSPYIRVTIKKK